MGPPTPSPQASVFPSPIETKGGGDTFAFREGVGGSKLDNWRKSLVHNLLCDVCHVSSAFQLRALKGPKLEIFDSRVFALIRPVWKGDLGSRPKILKS